MSYVPQFAFQTPDNFRDEQFSYSFDASNTPGLTRSVPANASIRNIQLELQSDAAFFLRAVKVNAQTGSVLSMQIYQDTFGNLIDNHFTPIDLVFFPSGGPVLGTLPVILSEELPCKAGGNIVINLFNPTGAPVACPKITFLGVKRLPR